MLDDPRRARVRAELKKHRRAVSPNPKMPHACLCGWKGDGNHGTHLADHLTDVVLTAVDLDGASPDGSAECPNPSIETIAHHRIDKEALCKGCERFLSTLA